MPRRGGKRKKTRTHAAGTKEEASVPQSFVFRRGKVRTERLKSFIGDIETLIALQTGPLVVELVDDMRKMMAPNTALKLKEKRTNHMKDYVHVAGPLGVTHFLMFSATENSVNFRVGRVPRGPTLSFKVVSYTLMRQIKAAMKRPVETTKAYLTSPLVVLNNFSAAEGDHVKLLTVTFQNMFPAIDVASVRLGDCRRVVLFHFDKASGHIHFRHYIIRAKPIGLSRSVKAIVHTKIPNLSKLEDISEFILGGGGGVGLGAVTSDSEADDEQSHVTLAQDYAGRGNKKQHKSAIRLSELGPRLSLQLVKVERGLCEGDVLYHAFVTKSAEDAAADKKRHLEREALKRQRKEEQEENLARKKAEQEAKAAAKEERRKAREEAKKAGQAVSDEEEDEEEAVEEKVDSDDDDAAYYREAVGEEPEAGLFTKRNKHNSKRRADEQLTRAEKRRKKEEELQKEAKEREERRQRNRQKKKEKKATALKKKKGRPKRPPPTV